MNDLTPLVDLGSRAHRAIAYADLARNLRPRQALLRTRRLLSPAQLAVGLREEPPPGWRPLAAGLFAERAPQSGPLPLADEDGVFRAVGVERRFAPGHSFWLDDGDGMLFLFALHGFRGLRPARCWEAIVTDWLACCGRPAEPGWHPYATSARILAWCAGLSQEGWPTALAERLRASLWLQARYLARAVEHDIGGNHVLQNGVALTAAGVCLSSERVLRQGGALLRTELKRQLLSDGGHEERSTSYQRSLLDQLHDLGVLLARAGRRAAWLADATDAMAAWQSAVTAPDGSLPRVGDAWDGPPLSPATEPLSDLPETGWVALRAGGDFALILAGPLGPRHLPAHVHAHALSFIFTAGTGPVVIDPGAGNYAGSVRNSLRATLAHATVAVRDRDQCTFLGPFRAAHLPNVRRVRLDRGEDAVVLVAEHDGYRPVLHRRAFCWFPGEGMVVVDRLSQDAHITTSLPLGPGAGAFDLEPFGPGGTVATEAGVQAPYLGTLVSAPVLRRRGHVPGGAYFGWSILRTSGGHIAARNGGVVIERPGRPSLALRLD